MSAKRCMLLVCAVSLAITGMAARPAQAGYVSLELFPFYGMGGPPASLSTGEEYWIDIWATAVPDSEVFPLTVFQAVFTWDPGVLALVDFSTDDADDSAGDVDFFHVGWGGPLNENSPLPPSDGDGMFVLSAPLFDSVEVTSGGELIGSLIFQVVADAPSTRVDLLRNLGNGTTDVRALISPGFEQSVGPQPGAENLLSTAVIPEPGAALMLGLLGIAALRRHGDA